jgi:hypothetical protein
VAVSNLNFHSYFSIMTGADSNALSDSADEEENIFDEDKHSSFTATTVSSPDITFTSSDGKITFGASGTYLLVGNLAWTVSGNTDTTIKIYKNGSAAYQMVAVPGFASLDPHSASYHVVLDFVAGDYIEIKISTDDTSTLTVQEGTTFVALKANGDCGSLTYTADANAQSSNNDLDTIGDSDLGGTVATNLKNVTFTASAGTLTPANTRPFLMLSTLVGTHSTNAEAAFSLYTDGGALDTTSAMIHTSLDPQEVTYGILKALTADETASSRFQSASGKITLKSGTSFSVFDVSNNGGIYPSAYLSLAVNADSDANTTGDIICFDSNEWGSYADTDHVTATGITFTADGGTFVAATAGKYFVLWNLVIGSAGSPSTVRTLKIINGSTTIYSSPWVLNQNFDPLEKTVCLVVEAAAGDSFTFVVNAPDGKFDAGTAITMFKVDDLKDLTVQSTPSKQVADDYTINTLDSDVMGKQRDNVTGKVFPFSLSQKGPRTLRGRTTSYSPSMGGKVKK